MSELQVGKVYFELVDYLEADRAFSLARHASPHSLEGMDVYSTVLYVSSFYWSLEQIVSTNLLALGFTGFGGGGLKRGIKTFLSGCSDEATGHKLGNFYVC